TSAAGNWICAVALAVVGVMFEVTVMSNGGSCVVFAVTGVVRTQARLPDWSVRRIVREPIRCWPSRAPEKVAMLPGTFDAAPASDRVTVLPETVPPLSDQLFG